MSTISYLIYASTAAQDLGQDELLSLLAQARAFNAKRDLTGLLLYSPGRSGEPGTFVQVLEGHPSDVQTLYQRITKDRRHRDCTILQEGSRFARRFSGWTMGFRDLTKVRPEDVPGFDPIFLQNWTLTQVLAQRDPVLQLLYSFAGV